MDDAGRGRPKPETPLSRSREVVCLAATAVSDVPCIQKRARANRRDGGPDPMSRFSYAIKGTTPEGLTDAEAVVYLTAFEACARWRSFGQRELARGRGQAWEMMARLAWLMWSLVWCVTATLLNLGAVNVPSGQADVVLLRCVYVLYNASLPELG